MKQFKNDLGLMGAMRGLNGFLLGITLVSWNIYGFHWSYLLTFGLMLLCGFVAFVSKENIFDSIREVEEN